MRDVERDEARALRALVKTTRLQWYSRRRGLAARFGSGYLRFTDPAALKSVATAVERVFMSVTRADIEHAIARHASDPKANPWYLDEWAREEAAMRIEVESREQKMRERAEEMKRPRHVSEDVLRGFGRPR